MASEKALKLRNSYLWRVFLGSAKHYCIYKSTVNLTSCRLPEKDMLVTQQGRVRQDSTSGVHTASQELSDLFAFPGDSVRATT